MNKTIVSIIPARGGSKSIPLKNIKLINGKPLICWSIDATIECKYINNVYVSTDDDRILNLVYEYKKINNSNYNFKKLQCIPRSQESSTDGASTEIALLEFAKKYNFDYIMLIQATNPLLRSTDLTHAWEKYIDNKYDSLLSVVKQKRFIWKEDKKNKLITPQNYDYFNRPRRQEFDGFLVENGSFYITKRNLLLETKSRISGKIGYYETPIYSYFEIDELEDWGLVENIMKYNIEH